MLLIHIFIENISLDFLINLKPREVLFLSVSSYMNILNVDTSQNTLSTNSFIFYFTGFKVQGEIWNKLKRDP